MVGCHTHIQRTNPGDPEAEDEVQVLSVFGCDWECEYRDCGTLWVGWLVGWLEDKKKQNAMN